MHAEKPYTSVQHDISRYCRRRGNAHLFSDFVQGTWYINKRTQIPYKVLQIWWTYMHGRRRLSWSITSSSISLSSSSSSLLLLLWPIIGVVHQVEKCGLSIILLKLIVRRSQAQWHLWLLVLKNFRVCLKQRWQCSCVLPPDWDTRGSYAKRVKSCQLCSKYTY